MVSVPPKVCYLCKEPSYGWTCRACKNGLTPFKKAGVQKLSRYKGGHTAWLKRKL